MPPPVRSQQQEQIARGLRQLQAQIQVFIQCVPMLSVGFFDLTLLMKVVSILI